MARKRKDVADGKPSLAKRVKVSVRLDPDEHRRLKALALATGRTEDQCIRDALTPHLLTVRIPWVVRTGDLPGPPESDDRAA